MSRPTDQRDAIDLYSGFRLANIAGVGIPSPESAYGVAFLSDVGDTVLEYLDNDDLTDDALHEIADITVPVCNIDLMRTLVDLVDLAAWDEDTVELAQPNASILELARAALYGVAYRLASALKAELDTAAGEDND